MSYGKECCARVKIKIVLLVGDEFFVITMVEYTLEQRIFMYDAYVEYSSNHDLPTVYL